MINRGKKGVYIMKRKNATRILMLVLFVSLLITGCGSRSKSSNMAGEAKFSGREKYDAQDYDTGSSVGYEAEVDTSYTSGPEALQVAPKETSFGNSSSISSSVSKTQDKIIRRVRMEVETQEFDQLIETINQKIETLGGYVESSSITGQRYYYSEDSRYGKIVARIPGEHLDEFTGTVSNIANVVNSEMMTENITLQYVDIESRKKALKIEQERLFAILEKEETLENIITLESRLSDIRYELQSIESQLRIYDNQVEYSTVILSIYEVERITPTTPVKKTVWNRIQTGFSNTMFHISEGFKNFVVWFVVNIPYLIIWGGILTAIVLITRKIYHKRERKNRIENNIENTERTDKASRNEGKKS